ncbi:MAG: N-acetylmuramoyl-L-alanine amidase [Lachnospiraceae bacterium]|nr:N-acetylmuramoyl-L-alanine amidase [Lachnospiraceae bacterium]
MKENTGILYIYITILLTAIFLCIAIPAKKVQAASVDWNVIALDPGHGGEEDGAYYYGKKEKDINYAIAVKVKQQLEAYEGVTVVLTREKDEEVNLANRVVRAKEADADVFISLHCNASVSHKSQGASVYISTGAKWRKTLQDFADCFLGEFEAVGLDNAGTFARVTQMGGRREDGTFDDYYGVLRHSYNNGIPALLVEHCYMDSETDRIYVKDENGITQLAQADANAIAAFCGLEKADGTKVKAKHAKAYGATTKARELKYYDAPNVTGIKLLSYDGKTPGIATYSVSVQDEIGITSLYLVYQNASGSSVTVPLEYRKSLTTGEWEVKAYIPENMSLETYSLCYVGAYNAAGYDAGYNLADGEMIGFGACDWLNTFSYHGEADLTVITKGSLSTAHAKKIQNEIEMGLRNRKNIYPISFYPY